MSKRGPFKLAADFALAQALFGIARGVNALPLNHALATADVMGRTIGPRTARHRVVQNNVARAFPRMAEAERRQIACASWGHQARLIVESSTARTLFDWHPAKGGDRVEVVWAVDPREWSGSPVLFFTGHIGCFELLPRTAAALGVPLATLFRPPSNRWVAQRVASDRTIDGNVMVPTNGRAAATLSERLRSGQAAAVLVDQKFRRGPKIPFMERPARTNPLVARLVDLSGALLVPARCIRLPDYRYRVEIEAPMAVPRDGSDRVDISATLHAVNAKIEDWVHDTPEQWMWFHRRWD